MLVSILLYRWLELYNNIQKLSHINSILWRTTWFSCYFDSIWVGRSKNSEYSWSFLVNARLPSSRPFGLRTCRWKRKGSTNKHLTAEVWISLRLLHQLLWLSIYPLLLRCLICCASRALDCLDVLSVWIKVDERLYYILVRFLVNFLESPKGVPRVICKARKIRWSVAALKWRRS